MVETPNDNPPAREGLIAKGCELATGAAINRLGSYGAVTVEFDRILAKVQDAIEGEQSDTTTLVLHACLITLLLRSVEEVKPN